MRQSGKPLWNWVFDSMRLRAGVGRRDISPRASTFLHGYPHRKRLSTGVHDPLFATALCLNDGQTTLLMIAVDILFIHHDSVKICRERIRRTTGIPDEHIMVSATHTHSGPVTVKILASEADPVVPPPAPEYMEAFHEGIVDAGIEAFNKLEDADFAATSVDVEGVGGNRHTPDGPHDPELGLVILRRAGTVDPIAVQLCYSMHPTVLHEDSTLVSSDFPGCARQLVEKEFPGSLVLYHTGPAGNLSPRHHVSGQTFAEARRLGGVLGLQAVNALSRIDRAAFRAEISLACMTNKVELVEKKFPPVGEAVRLLSETAARFEGLKTGGAPHGPLRTAECAVFGAEELVSLSRAFAEGRIKMFYEDYRPVEVQAFRIGKMYIAALPGECFVEYALEIKRRSGEKTFVVSLANGELQGYVATPGATGYEASNGLFAPASGNRLVEAAIDLLGELARAQ